ERPRGGFVRLRSTLGAMALAAALASTQVLVAVAVAGHGNTWHDRYLSLCIWDGGWYLDIVQHGYRTTSPPNAGAQYNLAFFPGYPIAASLLRVIIPVSGTTALLLISQIAAAVFWCV